MSGDGSVVVGSGRRNALDEEGEAFVFDVDHGARPLVEVLASLGIALPGWRLTSADSISADGRTILGNALDPEGQLRSFIAVIPEPATAVLVGAGLVGLAWHRRRRGRSSGEIALRGHLSI
ncbi:MAG: PEP-CTERM sorting domain-containing protein [Deltaproteobacteria bacterium]|nr:PEP-CTERM sorting domain-containing protein [Deltaproteobacteria bacterium]